MLYEIHHPALGLLARVAGEDMLGKELRRLRSSLATADQIEVVEVGDRRRERRRVRGAVENLGAGRLTVFGLRRAARVQIWSRGINPDQ